MITIIISIITHVNLKFGESVPSDLKRHQSETEASRVTSAYMRSVLG